MEPPATPARGDGATFQPTTFQTQASGSSPAMEAGRVPALPDAQTIDEHLTEESMRRWMNVVRAECIALRAGLEEVSNRHNTLLEHTRAAFDLVHVKQGVTILLLIPS